MSQLIRVLPADALPDLALFYHLLLSALPVLTPAAGSRPDKEEPRFVNALVRAIEACDPICKILYPAHTRGCRHNAGLRPIRHWAATCCRACGAGWRKR